MENIKGAFSTQFEPIVNKIGGLSKVQRYVIYCGTILVIIAIYLYMLYLPTQEKITAKTKEHEKLSAQLQKYKDKAAQYESAMKKMEEAKVEFQMATRLLPEKKDIPELLTSISQAGRDAGLQFLLFQPMTEVNKGFYAEIPVSIQVNGSYHNVAYFFDKVAHLSRIVNIRNISISGGNNLRVSCTAVTYKFIDKTGITTAKNKKKKNRRRRR